MLRHRALDPARSRRDSRGGSDLAADVAEFESMIGATQSLVEQKKAEKNNDWTARPGYVQMNVNSSESLVFNEPRCVLLQIHTGANHTAWEKASETFA